MAVCAVKHIVYDGVPRFSCHGKRKKTLTDTIHTFGQKENGMKKYTIMTFLAVLLLVTATCFGFVSAYAVHGESESETTTEYFGISDVVGYDTSNRDFVAFEVSFSRDAFMKEDMSGIAYRIIDGKNYAGEDFTYLQDYIELNGKTMRTINTETDVSDYEFSTFPSGVDHQFDVPVVIYAKTTSCFQMRVHRDWLEDNGLTGGGFKLTFKAGLYCDAKTTNEDLSAYIPVRYEIKEDITLTYEKGEWKSNVPYESYTPTEEVIERKDIDFSQINYDEIKVTDISRFVGYGDFKQIDGKSVQNQYLQITFDKPVFYQTVDYASVSKKHMKNLCSNTMTEEQIDAWFDYRLDLSFANYLVIDGRTLKEIKNSAKTDVQTKIFTQYSGNPYTMAVYIEAEEGIYVDATETHTITFKQGFRTPLFGEIKEDATFYYDPVTLSWRNSVSEGTPDYGSETEVVVGYQTKKGCSANGLSLVSVLPLTLAGACLLIRRKNHD